ncbi:MAG: hypothetical protein PHG53_09685 [Phycisphaerae bacterium]|nr:hypothetical protein [Phycisphaerae bacterium]
MSIRDDLHCPKCKARIIVDCLASNPPQYECRCCRCDWGLRYFQRADSFAQITQEEIESTGCEKCDKLKGNRLCPTCEIEMCESCILQNMNRVEELKQELKGKKVKNEL